MSCVNFYKLPNLVIASGQTTSNVIEGRGQFHRATRLYFLPPAALTGTVVIEGSLDGGSTYDTISAVTAGTPGTVVNIGAYTHIRAVSDGAEGATRTFVLRAGEGDTL